MTRISIEDLMTMMARPGVEESDLAPYFVEDEENSAPFAPRFRLNPETVAIPPGPDGAQRSALLLNSANWLARVSRRDAFYSKLRSGYDGPVLVSEGDSWFQYPFRLEDTIDVLMRKYAVLSLGAAGDLLERMAAKREYLRGLADTGASVLLFSGGGNDLLGNGALADHLERFDPSFRAGDYLKPSFSQLLSTAFGHYERILRSVHGSFPHVSVICHGYDYPVPDGGRWLGKPMESQGIRDKAVQKAIAAEMMDRFNTGLRRLCRTMPHVSYVDVRGVVGDGRWYDELHPNDAGYADVAACFAQEIARITRTRSGPVRAVSGPFGTPAQMSRELPPDLAASGAAGRGVSLHLGLNSVDPAHYAGWDGRLAACENDALAMADLAGRQAFATTTLLTAQATRSTVVREIERAAESLGEGDMFLMSVSAHGGRIPDFNRDEDHDGDHRMDETLCLYDFQIADDELFMLWSKFRAGVRILLVADTCHSGSMIRFNPFDPAAIEDGMPLVPDPRVRCMPRHIETKVWRQNLGTYRDAARSFAEIRETIVLNPLTTPVKASVLNFGACQDHQQAMDGDEYGAFTGAVLKVWNNGRFDGDYETMRARADTLIGSANQTPNLFTKLVKDEGFLRQVPFTLFPRATPGDGLDLGFAGAPAVVVGAAREEAAALHDPARALLEEESGEEDPLDPAEIDDLLDRKQRDGQARSSDAALSWADYGRFRAFIDGLGLANFSADEFLILGGAHNSAGSRCAGRNQYPPRELWPNIAATARVLDHFRARIGHPVVITNAYRAPRYNACIGGASQSWHMRFAAIDFAVSGLSSADAAEALRWMRDREGAFAGGIGRYNSFVHIDTRGANTTWPHAFRDSRPPTEKPAVLGPSGSQVPTASAAPTSSPRPPARPETGQHAEGGLVSTLLEALNSVAGSLDLDDRRERVRQLDLAPRRSGTPRASRSVFAGAAARSAGEVDATDQAALHQSQLAAAVSASSVMSFVENLNPGQKEDVLLSTLFAQRAADASFDPIEDREGWYRRYSETLGLLGWAVEGAPVRSHQHLGSAASFDQAIIATLAAVATGNQLRVVQSALEALRSLSDADGTIRLFDFETSRTTGSNFQIGAAEASGDIVSMAMGAFNFTHEDRRKNVLFVTWGDRQLEFWLQVERLALSPMIYRDVRDLVKDRLSDARKRLIADIPL